VVKINKYQPFDSPPSDFVNPNKAYVIHNPSEAQGPTTLQPQSFDQRLCIVQLENENLLNSWHKRTPKKAFHKSTTTQAWGPSVLLGQGSAQP